MEEKERGSYPSDLTDEQWEEIAPLYTGMRNCTWSKRELTDAVLYLVDSGCKWRQLPHDFPPYSTVHSFYRRARIRRRLKIGNMPSGKEFFRRARQSNAARRKKARRLGVLTIFKQALASDIEK